MRDDFCVFILSHGRADNVVTWDTLTRCGYTGRRVIVIDDEDDQAEEYFRRYGDDVVQFCKLEAAKNCDSMDTSGDRRIVLFARNECFRIAREMGVRSFLELDDDYKDFELRYIADGRLKEAQITDFDGLCEKMLEFLESSGALTVALAQGGDFIGGVGNTRFHQGLMRKAMNSFFCMTDRPFKFLGRINEDVNTYTLLGNRGDLFFTVTRVMLVQTQTQAQGGGMTGLYLDRGTYEKSFYSVICVPSAVTVEMMGPHRRIHHRVRWDNCVPKIVSDRWRRA